MTIIREIVQMRFFRKYECERTSEKFIYLNKFLYWGTLDEPYAVLTQ